jgi:hypothetical protein
MVEPPAPSLLPSLEELDEVLPESESLVEPEDSVPEPEEPVPELEEPDPDEDPDESEQFGLYPVTLAQSSAVPASSLQFGLYPVTLAQPSTLSASSLESLDVALLSSPEEVSVVTQADSKLESHTSNTGPSLYGG